MDSSLFEAGRVTLGNPLHHVVSTSEAAALLDVSTSYVRRLCGRGRLDARQTDGLWLITRSSVERYDRERAG